jgi:predicted molibdopterin-dependent oxidoreductase YjgC
MARRGHGTGQLGLAAGDAARVVTEAGHLQIDVEGADRSRPGMVLIPRDSDLEHGGAEHGANVNRPTRSTHRDPIAGTPLHRFVPCRMDPAAS